MAGKRARAPRRSVSNCFTACPDEVLVKILRQLDVEDLGSLLKVIPFLLLPSRRQSPRQSKSECILMQVVDYAYIDVASIGYSYSFCYYRDGFRDTKRGLRDVLEWCGVYFRRQSVTKEQLRAKLDEIEQRKDRAMGIRYIGTPYEPGECDTLWRAQWVREMRAQEMVLLPPDTWILETDDRHFVSGVPVYACAIAKFRVLIPPVGSRQDVSIGVVRALFHENKPKDKRREGGLLSGLVMIPLNCKGHVIRSPHRLAPHGPPIECMPMDYAETKDIVARAGDLCELELNLSTGTLRLSVNGREKGVVATGVWGAMRWCLGLSSGDATDVVVK